MMQQKSSHTSARNSAVGISKRVGGLKKEFQKRLLTLGALLGQDMASAVKLVTDGTIEASLAAAISSASIQCLMRDLGMKRIYLCLFYVFCIQHAHDVVVIQNSYMPW